ncbi:MAG: type IV secretion system DNA-binding domain-containing protein [Rubrivivax sp.]
MATTATVTGTRWDQSPLLLALYLALILAVLVMVARKRGAGFDTYWRMPLHVLAILFISMVVKHSLHWVFDVPAGNDNLNRTSWWYLIVSPAVAFLWGFFRYWPSGPPADAHKRGAVVTDGQAALQQTERLKARHGENLLTLAGVWVPPADETKHFKLIGTTGAGKSTAIRELLHQALQRGDRAVIADPDGGYLASFYDRGRGDVILNPFDARSRKWSVFADIGNIQDADLMARSLIPDTGSTGNSAREWSGYARTFVSAVLRQCMANGEMDSAELWRLIAVASTDELRTLLAGTAAQPFLEADNARMFGSIRSVAANAIATLEYVHAQEGHAAFSVRQWVRSGRGVLYLPYQAEQIAALRTLIATWVRLAIFQTMGLGEGDHRIWFVVDELDALGPIDGLKDALARLRKFGGRCVLGFQSIAQVSSTYGDGPARTIVENCSNTLILRCSASEGGGTAKFASQLIGQREVIRPTVTHSTGIEGKFIGREVDRGTSYGEEHRVEDAVMASEIEALPDRVGYLKFASRPAWTLVGFEYFEPDGRVKVFQAV